MQILRSLEGFLLDNFRQKCAHKCVFVDVSFETSPSCYLYIFVSDINWIK